MNTLKNHEFNLAELLFDALDQLLSMDWSALVRKVGDAVVVMTFVTIVLYWLFKFGGAIYRFLWVL